MKKVYKIWKSKKTPPIVIPYKDLNFTDLIAMVKQLELEDTITIKALYITSDEYNNIKNLD